MVSLTLGIYWWKRTNWIEKDEKQLERLKLAALCIVHSSSVIRHDSVALSFSH